MALHKPLPFNVRPESGPFPTDVESERKWGLRWDADT
jgi:hypothetical protein